MAKTASTNKLHKPRETVCCRGCPFMFSAANRADNAYVHSRALNPYNYIVSKGLLHYVLVSRLWTLTGILFQETSNFDHIQPSRPTPTMSTVPLGQLRIRYSHPAL
jgi:hypothetical protein